METASPIKAVGSAEAPKKRKKKVKVEKESEYGDEEEKEDYYDEEEDYDQEVAEEVPELETADISQDEKISLAHPQFEKSLKLLEKLKEKNP